MERFCKDCETTKSESSFELIRGGPKRRRSCWTCRARKKRKHNPAQYAQMQARSRHKHRHTSILVDSRKEDRKKGREGNDLDGAYIKEMITHPCLYCGLSEQRMTLDRIDNTQAHKKGNVNPCCLRCNLIRGNMPYRAWVALVPRLIEIIKEGLLDDWQPKRRGRVWNE